MIEKSTHRTRLVQLTGYVIFCISFIALFFTNRLEFDFSAFQQHMPIGNIYSNVTVRNSVLLVLNISLAVIISEGFKNGDERIKVIRDYVTRYALKTAIWLALIMGLLLKTNNILLVYAAIIQGFYLVVFQICKYRDTAMIYMNEEQLKAYSKKMKRRFCIYVLVHSLFLGAMPAILMAYHRNDLMPLIFIVSCGIFALLHTVYMHWKS